MLRPTSLESGNRCLLRSDHSVGIVEHRTASSEPVARGIRRELLQIEIIISEIDGEASCVVVAGRVVRDDGAVCCDELLQAGQLRIAALFIIDFHPDVKLLGSVGGVDAKPRGIGGESFVPVLYEPDSANRKDNG